MNTDMNDYAMMKIIENHTEELEKQAQYQRLVAQAKLNRKPSSKPNIFRQLLTMLIKNL